MSNLKIFGIRHHGAGSAARVLAALEQARPEAIGIEMPYESANVIKHLSTSDHNCPLAFLYYNPENTNQSMYYPFAEFSPEYQAMKFAFEHSIPIYPIDLPAGISLVQSNFKTKTEDELNSKQKSIVNDPLAYLAWKSGYADTERWWNSYFESWTDSEELFDVVSNLMTELRLSTRGLDDFETLAREEFMRIQLQKIQTEHKNVAVICGAWHVPALIDKPILPKNIIDISGLKSIQVQTSLIPWSYSRLSLNRSYTAGIESPVWSELIFKNSNTAIAQWLAMLAREFKELDIIIPPSDLIDCHRMATELSMLRQIPLPGIEELLDSAISVIAKGEAQRLDFIKNRIIKGHKTGKVELQADTLNLIREFKTRLKELGLIKYWAENPNELLELDLRKERHLKISRFLHQTILLQLNWCTPKELDFQSKGNFHEHWNCSWNPDLEIELVNIAIQAQTIEEAILKIISDALESSNDIALLAHLLVHGVRANLETLWPLVLEKINHITLHTNEVISLCKIIQPLVSSISYGNLHQTDVNLLIEIVDRIIPKIILELGSQSCFIKDPEALELSKSIDIIVVYFTNNPSNDYVGLWKDQILLHSSNDSLHSRIRGKLWKIILAESWLNENEFLLELKFQFNALNNIQNTAQWLEGFIDLQSTFHLLHDRALQLINDWLISLSEESFREILPILRRSFSNLQTGEKIRIKQELIATSTPNLNTQNLHIVIDEEREKILHDLSKYFGTSK